MSTDGAGLPGDPSARKRDPIFALTRYSYDSYTDFRKLVELSGFPTCFVDEIDLGADETYITSPVNGELRPHVEHRRRLLEETKAPERARIIWWNLERPDVGPPLSSVLDDMFRYVLAVWVSDRYYASLDKRLTHVVLGSHPGLAGDETTSVRPCDFWYTHQSYVHGRREPVLAAFRREYAEGPNAWGAARDHTLRSSKMMLNVHQTPAPIMEPLRFALAAGYKLGVLSEKLLDPWPLVESTDYALGDYPGGLISAARTIYGYPEWFPTLGERLHEKLCYEWNFRRGVMDGLERTFPVIYPTPNHGIKVQVKRSEPIELGHDIQNAELRFLDDAPRGLYYQHPCKIDGVEQKNTPGYIPIAFVPHPERKEWKLVKVRPLSIHPSLLCTRCGHHGVITDGKWNPA